jgi:hypothetical protein
LSKLLKDLRAFDAVETCFAFGDTHHVTFKAAPPTEQALTDYLHDLNHKYVHVKPIEANVEDCFMRLSGKTLLS